MKKVLFIALMLIGMTTTAQSINGIELKDIDQEFVQILGTAKGLGGNKVTITINFGQVNKAFSSKDDGHIIGNDGKKVVFNSMIDALNFMHGQGYEYVDSNAVTIGGSNVFHFLLRKIR